MLKLEQTTHHDLPAIIALENDPENKTFIIPYSPERHLEVIRNSDEAHIKILDSSEKMIGFVIVAGLENLHHNIELRRLVIADKGKGYGKAALALIKQYCFEQHKCHRLWLDVFEDNLRARHLYKGAGFIEEGMMRECFKTENGYRSLVLMSILEKEVRRSANP